VKTWNLEDTSFAGNSDATGIITISRNGASIDVPAEALLYFAAEIVRARKIDEIEAMSTDALLGST
jgi:hypothetical protein